MVSSLDIFAQKRGFVNYDHYNLTTILEYRQKHPEILISTYLLTTKEVERRIMEYTQPQYRVGDVLRLKDTPYEGKFQWRTEGIISIELGDGTRLQAAAKYFEKLFQQPQIGDIYLDKNGHEWIIRAYRGNSNKVVAHVIDADVSDPLYISHPTDSNYSLEAWWQKFEPRLLRRRG